jgi:drug/metabolite transporter (DMT)-like permease
VGFLPAASILIQTGPRYLPAAEVSLLLLLETVIGTLLVWFFLGELPGPLAFAGGGIILLALAINGIIEDRRRHRAKRQTLVANSPPRQADHRHP